MKRRKCNSLYGCCTRNIMEIKLEGKQRSDSKNSSMSCRHLDFILFKWINNLKWSSESNSQRNVSGYLKPTVMLIQQNKVY
jgi:hypothetical protein